MVDPKDKRIAELERQLADEERKHLKTIDERDHHEESINQIAVALGLKCEWSNLCDVGEECINACSELKSQLAEAKEDTARLKAAIDEVRRSFKRKFPTRTKSVDMIANAFIRAIDAAREGDEVMPGGDWIDVLHQKIDRLETELAAEQAKVANLASLQEKRVNEIWKLRPQVDRLDGENDDLRQQLAAERAKVAELVAQIDKLESDEKRIRDCIAMASLGIDPRDDTRDWLAQVLQIATLDHFCIEKMESELTADRAKVALAVEALRGTPRTNQHLDTCSFALSDEYECDCGLANRLKIVVILQSEDALADIRHEVARECAEIVKAGRIDSSEGTLAMLRKLAAGNAKLCLDTIVEEVGYCAALAIRAKFGVTE